MRAAVLEEYGKPLHVEDVDLAPPREREVYVRVRATGVCHSDRSIQEGKLPYPVPCVPGHEAAGVVEEIGPGVRRVQPGDHIVAIWHPMCRQCFFCLRGQPQLCEAHRDRRGLMDDGTSRLSRGGELLYHGINSATFAEACVLRETGVVPIPTDVPFDVAAVLGCAALTGVGAAVRTARVQPGEMVVVIGCGGVGVNVIQGARLAGAEPIVAVDSVAGKLETAKRFGATHTVDASTTDAREVILELTAGRRADVAFEVVGSPGLQRQAVELTRRGGRVVFVGAPPFGSEVTLDALTLALGERQLLGCFHGSSDPVRDVPHLLALWRSGKLDLPGLITRTAPLEDVNRAFGDMDAGTVVRTVLHP